MAQVSRGYNLLASSEGVGTSNMIDKAKQDQKFSSVTANVRDQSNLVSSISGISKSIPGNPSALKGMRVPNILVL